MSFFFALKIVVVLFFLGMFFRQSNWVWGIGLLTVTTAVFFDTLLSVFGSTAITELLGFFYFVVAGLILGGMGVWLLGLIRPSLLTPTLAPETTAVAMTEPLPYTNQLDNSVSLPRRGAPMANNISAHDRQLLYDQIRLNLGPDDVLDLIFDLEINENDVLIPGDRMENIINRIIDLAHQRRQMGELALAIERILTPVPPDHFPRLEKLSEKTPPGVLRRYLLGFYFLDQIEQMAHDLQVDWELLGTGSKQNKVRSLLLYLRRRQRVDDLVTLMQAQAQTDEPVG